MSRLRNTTCIALAWALSCCATPASTPPPVSPPPPPPLVLRADPPGPGPTASLKAPSFRVAVLDNGLTVYALDSSAVQSPIVQVEFITLGGAAAEGHEQARIAIDVGTLIMNPRDVRYEDSLAVVERVLGNEVAGR